MRRLRKPPRVDGASTPTSQAPVRRGRLGRLIYIALLTLVIAYLFDLLVGNRLYLSADGMVLRDTRAIGRDFPLRVQRLHVRDGQTIRAGEPLLRVRSVQRMNRLTDSQARVLMHEQQVAEREARLASTAARLATAKSHLAVLRKTLADRRQLLAAEAGTRQMVIEAREQLLQAQAKQLELEEQKARLEAALPRHRDRLAQARTAFDRLQQAYDRGRVWAPVTGTVAGINHDVGESVAAGDELLRIHHGPRHVLAYLPVARWYSITEGQAVEVRVGLRLLAGRIERIYPLAPELPEEFQAMFGVVDRRQLIRVALREQAAVGDAPAPLFTTVTVAGHAEPMALLLRMLEAVRGRVDAVVRGALAGASAGGGLPDRPENRRVAGSPPGRYDAAHSPSARVEP